MNALHEHAPHRPQPQHRRVLWLALAANAVLLLAEVAAGLAFRSLALLADAAHLLTDVTGLGLAAFAVSLMARPATSRHTYGMLRVEALAAQANALILIGVAAWVLVEAVRRLAHPVHISGAGVLAVASLGLVVNLGSAWVLHRVGTKSLNVRGAFLHLAADALGSLGAMAAATVILIWDNHRADPIVSILISGLVVWAGLRLLRDTLNILMEGAPSDFDASDVERALITQPNVRDVHHLHVWDLASDTPALSAHVVLAGEPSMHDAQLEGERIKAMLLARFGIEHATLELECHGPAGSHNENNADGGGRGGT